jgi:hypothetical protein
MTAKEQLSASKQKIVLPNKELVGVKKEEKKEIDESSKLPEPTGWRILVLPFKQKEKTLNDDEVLATVENPEDIFHEF